MLLGGKIAYVGLNSEFFQMINKKESQQNCKANEKDPKSNDNLSKPFGKIRHFIT